MNILQKYKKFLFCELYSIVCVEVIEIHLILPVTCVSLKVFFFFPPCHLGIIESIPPLPLPPMSFGKDGGIQGMLKPIWCTF